METGSVSRAVEAMHLTQPAVSKLVLALEEHLGSGLFRREHHGLLPTAEAMIFARESEALFGQFRRLDRRWPTRRCSVPPRGCVLPLAHPLARAEAVEPADLARENFISLGEEDRSCRQVDAVFAEAGVARAMRLIATLCHGGLRVSTARRRGDPHRPGHCLRPRQRRHDLQVAAPPRAVRS